MARKLELKTTWTNGLVNPNLPPEKFDYGEWLKRIAGWAPPGKGVVLSEAIAALAVIKPIEAAIKAKASSVTLTEEQWKLLHDKSEIFPWVTVDEVWVTFGLMIREAPEIT